MPYLVWHNRCMDEKTHRSKKFKAAEIMASVEAVFDADRDAVVRSLIASEILESACYERDGKALVNGQRAEFALGVIEQNEADDERWSAEFWNEHWPLPYMAAMFPKTLAEGVQVTTHTGDAA